MVRKLALSTLAIAASLAPQTLGASEGRGWDFERRLLSAHNEERANAGVPPLRWSEELAENAADWAEYLADQGRMIHANREQRFHAGENLWQGPAGFYSAEVIVGTFIDEKRYFRNGTFPDVSTTGRWRDVGHYTQVIWRETQEIGCAVVRNHRDEFLVCRYWPAGNWYGQNAL